MNECQGYYKTGSLWRQWLDGSDKGWVRVAVHKKRFARKEKKKKIRHRKKENMGRSLEERDRAMSILLGMRIRLVRSHLPLLL